MTSSSPIIERARPLLGTFVEICVWGMLPQDAHRAIDSAFAEIALIHERMSFQWFDSDVSHLNREAVNGYVPVHQSTYEVLELAREITQASGGVFDITIAPELARDRILPCPGSRMPKEDASALDIELSEEGRVHFRRPLWIDLGGIAKGYAVDRAIAELCRHGARQAIVNAGGDLRVLGKAVQHIRLRLEAAQDNVPVVEIKDASLASSETREPRTHIDPRKRGSATPARFVAVIAQDCAIADALTKPVLFMGAGSEELLKRYGASAFIHQHGADWTRIGAGDA